MCKLTEFPFKAPETQEACVTFSIELVENIPGDLSFPMDGTPHLPLSVGFHTLLDQAKRSVEVVSPVWALNSWELETMPSAVKQVQNHSRLSEYILQNISQLHSQVFCKR